MINEYNPEEEIEPVIRPVEDRDNWGDRFEDVNNGFYLWRTLVAFSWKLIY